MRDSGVRVARSNKGRKLIKEERLGAKVGRRGDGSIFGYSRGWELVTGPITNNYDVTGRVALCTVTCVC